MKNYINQRTTLRLNKDSPFKNSKNEKGICLLTYPFLLHEGGTAILVFATFVFKYFVHFFFLVPMRLENQPFVVGKIRLMGSLKFRKSCMGRRLLKLCISYVARKNQMLG